MKVVIQRVRHSSVTINNTIKRSIGKGLLVLFAVEVGEDNSDIDWLVGKVVNLRIFDDDQGVMNRSVLDIDGEVMVVSQFTLFAKTKKGNRPSYIDSAKHETAVPIYNEFCQRLSEALNKPVPTGEFGADMQVELLNDGPVTIIIDTKRRE
ncbi:MAG: D-tyrosyl-tRNA(Tyr) deacylase [Bacteroidales bacterium]|nr:D-tyrosyl-tRNA(Tyr) deacylase [Bacteroidales bacterium]